MTSVHLLVALMMTSLSAGDGRDCIGKSQCCCSLCVCLSVCVCLCCL